VIELKQDVAIADAGDTLIDDDPLSVDISGPVEEDGLVIDLSENEAVEESVPPPAVEAEQGGDQTLMEAKPPEMTPTPLPAIPADADPNETFVDEDEPEIEVSYGTDEALALQAELGLGEDGLMPDPDLESDQLTLVDLPYSMGEQPVGGEPADMDFDDLPAPPPQEADLEDLLEPSMLARPPSEAAPPPKQAEPAAEPARSPEPEPAPEPAVEPEPAAGAELDPVVEVKEDAGEEASGPLIELSMDDEFGDAEDDLVITEPATAIPKPVEPEPAKEPAKPAAAAAPTPAPAAKPEEPEQAEPAPPTAEPQKPATDIASALEAETAEVDVPSLGDVTGVGKAEEVRPEAESYGAPRPKETAAPVADLSGKVPSQRAKSLRALIRAALSVGVDAKK